MTGSARDHSPSTRSIEVVRKRSDYPRVGVAETWLVDPEVPAASLLRRSGEVSEFDLVAETFRGATCVAVLRHI